MLPLVLYLAERQRPISSAVMLFKQACPFTICSSCPAPVQLDHKSKLANVEAEAAEELRQGLGLVQPWSQQRKKLS